MKLNQFVEETLTQIISGIQQAQGSDIVKLSNAAIVPSGQSVLDEKIANQVIDFDVAITVQKDKETKGGIGIFVGGVGIGSQGKTDKSNVSINRVKFSVPIFFPSQKINRT